MKRFFGSVWFLALFISVPLIIFLPPFFERYKIVPEKSEIFGTNLLFHYYVDLNSDGVEEKIISYIDINERFCLQYFNEDQPAPVDQLNFPFDFSENLNKLYFEDIDEDGFVEIYGFTIKEDSLLLSWFEPYPNKNSVPQSKFITVLGTYDENKIDMRLTKMHFIDLDLDGNKEFVFPVFAGYSITPRSIFVYNPYFDSVRSSEFTGNIQNSLVFADIAGDEKLEIIANNNTSGNMKDSLGNLHIDIVTRLQVFNSDLDLVFPPVEFCEGLFSDITSFVVDNNELLTFSFSETDLPRAMVYRVSAHGKKLDSMKIPDLVPSREHNVFKINKQSYIVTEGNYQVMVSPELKMGNPTQLPIDDLNPLGFFLKFNGKSCMVYGDPLRKKLVFFVNNKKLELEFPQVFDGINSMNFYAEGKFYLVSNSTAYYFRVNENPWYFLKFPFYILLYLFSVAFVWAIQAVRVKQLQRKYELQNQIRELELRSFHSQMDPHFMFNAFTTMASLLKKGSLEEAYNAFTKFSKLVRINFEYSQKVVRPLKDELQVVADFLEINKMRFQDKLNFSIDLEVESLIYTKVPKMALQIHVENALKHGLSKKNGHGFVSVYAKKDADYLYLMVEDDGIGREKAKLLKRPSTRQGHKMLQSVFERLNSLNKLKIKQQITDLKNENGDAAGTRVEIWIPLNLKD